MRTRWPASIPLTALLAVILLLSLVLASCAGPTPDPNTGKTPSAIDLVKGKDYSTVLARLKKNATGSNIFWRGDIRNDAMGAPEAAADAATGGQKTSHSTTNVQVAGVDEADLVKTDGSFLYIVANSRLYIVDVRIPSAPVIVADMTFMSETKYAYPMEIFLDEDAGRLVVVMQSQEILPAPTGTAPEDGQSDAAIAPDIAPRYYYYYMSNTELLVFDVADPAKPEVIRQYEQQGNYVATRRIGTAVYLVTSRYAYYEPEASAEQLLPSVREDGGEWTLLPPDRIGMLPNGEVNSFLVVGAIDTVDLDREADAEAVLGSGYTVYASTNALYIVASRWVAPAVDVVKDLSDAVGDVVDGIRDAIGGSDSGTSTEPSAGSGEAVPPEETNPDVTAETPPDEGGSGESPDGTVEEKPDEKPIEEPTGEVEPSEPFVLIENYPPVEIYTDIYRFRLDGASVTADGTGVVPGYILNQFSMDEQDGYFRIATTSGESWRNDQFTSLNHLYVLDKDLKVVGKVEGLAARETIKSVRFIGNRAYLVTFRTTDPLFVIDLEVPAEPKVLGELKIPGYSEYLHPYGENLLMGIGKDAVAIGDNAFYLGLKLSMFDVSDPANPVELHTLIIGDRGTQSEVTWNHKAFLVDSENGLFGMPIQYCRVPESARQDPIAYGELIYNGFFLFDYDASAGFKLLGSVSHDKEPMDWTKPIDNYGEGVYNKGDFDWYAQIFRGVTVGDNLMTVSNRAVMVNRLDNLETLSRIELPNAEQPYYYGAVDKGIPEPAIAD